MPGQAVRLWRPKCRRFLCPGPRQSRAAARPVRVSPVPPMASMASAWGESMLAMKAALAGHIVRGALDQEIAGRVFMLIGPGYQIRQLVVLVQDKAPGVERGGGRIRRPKRPVRPRPG